MIMTRWQAAQMPNLDQMKLILAQEGLEPYTEVFNSSTKISDHRHPFTEVRIVISGELLTNIAGNQVLLRPGDRIEISANTKHSYQVQGNEPCACLCAEKVF